MYENFASTMVNGASFYLKGVVCQKPHVQYQLSSRFGRLDSIEGGASVYWLLLRAYEFVRLTRPCFRSWAVGVQRFSRETVGKFSCPV